MYVYTPGTSYQLILSGMMYEVYTYYTSNSIAGVSVQRFVVNEPRLLGGPSFAGGHDQGTL